MSSKKAPKTTVADVKTSIEEALRLSALDGPQEVINKGLYDVSDDQPVVVFDGSEVIAITTAGKLRGKILPRSWDGPLGERLGHLSPPPEIADQARVASLDFLVQQSPDTDWLLVVESEAGGPAGILDRAKVMEFMPTPDKTAEIVRTDQALLWGDPDVDHVFYYCPVEKRYYGPHTVRPGPDGKMRDRWGHIVEKCDPSNPL